MKSPRGIYEVLEVTPQLRRMIHRARPVHELREVIAKSGGLTLRQGDVRRVVKDPAVVFGDRQPG